jgi:hypothetical protein
MMVVPKPKAAKTRWTCERCAREFGRAHQSHTCLPALSPDDTFDGRPPFQRSVYSAIIGHLRELGDVHEDAVGVGVFLKTARKLAEVRPKSKWVSLDVILPRRIVHPRVSRHISLAAGRTVHIIRVSSVDEVDDWVRGLLTEAYFAASDDR